jgi:hypothetical protein
MAYDSSLAPATKDSARAPAGGSLSTGSGDMNGLACGYLEGGEAAREANDEAQRPGPPRTGLMIQENAAAGRGRCGVSLGERFSLSSRTT